MAQRLLVISPVRNEAAHLERLVSAVAAQTRRPDRWLIVDDGSTDRTAQLARAAADRWPFCEALSAPPVVGAVGADERLGAAAEWRAFRWALQRAPAYDVLSKLDGDVVPDPDWFARLLAELDADPALGIAGGTLLEGERPLRVPSDHVPGAIKVYRRACLEDIGLPEATLGWDTVDEIRARAAGWTVRSFTAPTARHLRPCGAGGRALAGRARYGRVAWMLHQPWWWALLRSAKLALAAPPVMAGPAFLYGYAAAAARRVPRIEDPAVRAEGRDPLRRRPRPSRVPAANPGAGATVLLISPVRNEAAHLERVAAAVAAQTRPPDEWLVVDDGSTDETLAMLRRLSDEIPFMRLLEGPADLTPAVADRLAAAAAPRAFRWALKQSAVDWDYVGKLDGDTELPPHYLQQLLARFAAEPALGIAGGVRMEGRRRLDRPGDHVPGALKLYSAACYRAIGGMRETLAWDVIDETYAHLHGFRTRAFGDLVAEHHRAWGSADGRLRGRARFGRSLHVAGYPAPWVAVKAARVSALRPYGLSGAAFLYGFAHGRLTRVPRVRDRSYSRQLRRDLRHRAASAASRRREPVAQPHAVVAQHVS